MWNEFIENEKKQDYFRKLISFIEQDQKRFTIYPKDEDRFRAFDFCPFESVKVVILGQDPYHGEGQAHGLSFSVPEDMKIPPSLKNIYKELQSDIGMDLPSHGNLESWATQGVLLLNSVLTVRKASAGSHQKKGWEIFTDHVIEKLNNDRENLVFLLWGKPAQKKGSKIDRKKHLVLESVHPSPLSAYRGFFGCQHFSQANSYLKQNSVAPINWASLLT